jgi:hypothetical protein
MLCLSIIAKRLLTFASKEIGHDWNPFDCCACFRVAWSFSPMAAQSRLGLLAQRRFGPSFVNRHHLNGEWTNLICPKVEADEPTGGEKCSREN